MGKVEPYTEDSIAVILADAKNVQKDYQVEQVVRRLALAYGHAKADAEQMQFWSYHKEYDVPDDCVYCRENYPDGLTLSIEKHYWTPADWRNAVLKRIGWKE